jgi:hypothetical protein
MHYGTFWLSEEPLEEPLPRLLASAETMGLAERIAVVPEGETKIFRAASHAIPDHQEAGTATAQ